MILQPSVSRYKKQFKGKIKLKAKAGWSVVWGVFGLVTCAGVRIDGRQIEAARMAIMKHVKKLGKLWIRVFPDIPVTRKPIEVRMGKGKGEVEKWVFRAGAGRILFEVGGVPEEIARAALKAASFKFGVKTAFVNRANELLC